MAESTYFQRKLARRIGGSDITRLAGQYQKDVQGVTSQYQTEFQKYREQVAAQMAPYEAAVAQYKQTAEPQYQSALATYNQKLADYEKQLAEIAANPVTERTERVVVGRTWYGAKKYGTAYFYDPKPIPTFTEKAPVAPNAPEAPDVSAFDASQFEQKRAQLEEGFKREIGERRGSRLSAVQRKQRTMLGDAKT